MIYQRQFIKELSFTAVGVFVILLAILVSTQAINLLGRAASGRVAIDAVAALVGFWTVGLTPLLLILTAYISTLTVLTRYWRDSEMSVWLSCGLALKSWTQPVLRFAVPFALLVAAISLWLMPWAELRSREFAEILKQKQELSLIEPGVFREVGGQLPRVYFIESFDSDSGDARNLFIREKESKGRDSVILATSGQFTQEDGKRILALQNGHRYSGTPGQADYERAAFQSLSLIVSTGTKIVDASANRRTVPTTQLWHSGNPQHQAELMWRLSLPLSVLILSLLALPLSYYNPRSGHTYNILIAVGLFLVYQNGLTFLRDAVASGKLPMLMGLLPMHVLMLALFWLLLRLRSQPAQAFWPGIKAALGGKP